jgi:hypothetical protein
MIQLNVEYNNEKEKEKDEIKIDLSSLIGAITKKLQSDPYYYNKASSLTYTSTPTTASYYNRYRYSDNTKMKARYSEYEKLS